MWHLAWYRYAALALAVLTLSQLAWEKSNGKDPILCIVDMSHGAQQQSYDMHKHNLLQSSANDWWLVALLANPLHCCVSMLGWPFIYKYLPRHTWTMVWVTDMYIRILIASTLASVHALPFNKTFTFAWTTSDSLVHGMCLVSKPMRFWFPSLLAGAHQVLVMLMILLGSDP
jgi:hypothetical protein